MLAQLLEAALRSFCLGAAVWLTFKILRVRHPQSRMTAWTVVLLASLSMPLLMHWATVTIPLPSPPPAASSAVTAPADLKRPAEPAVFSSGGAGLASAADSASSPSSLEDTGRRTARAAIGWQTVAAGLYLAVTAGLLARLFAGVLLTWRLLRGAQPITEEWTAGLDVRVGAVIVTPVAAGAAVLLPAGCLEWSPAKRRAVLAHERSHLARGDVYVLLLAALHRAIFWFNPFSWWLLSELAETAELISDDAAIEALGDRQAYAEILLDIAGGTGRVPAGIAMARTRNVSKRVDRILAVTAPSPLRLDPRRPALMAVSLAPIIALTAASFAKQASTQNH
jgi:BlaR1 peptidase M56